MGDSSSTSGHFPKLVAFDLDYTLWDHYIDCCVGPLTKYGDGINSLRDRYSSSIAFYREVPQILHDLSALDIHVAAASRTSAVALANEALSKLIMPADKNAPKAPARTANSFFSTKEIYPSSKIKHFQALHKKTGIAYTDMLFFDDEHRNREVESLGVTFHLVDRGMNRAAWKKGLAEWRKRNPLPESTDEDEED